MVDAVGEGVDARRWATSRRGLRSFPTGHFAEAAIIPADRAYPIPDDITERDAAATLIAFQTAHVALHRHGTLTAGETLLVLGAAGGVGSAAIQLGVAVGARFIAVASGATKGAHCAALGADVVIDASTGDLGAEVAPRLVDAASTWCSTQSAVPRTRRRLQRWQPTPAS